MHTYVQVHANASAALCGLIGTQSPTASASTSYVHVPRRMGFKCVRTSQDSMHIRHSFDIVDVVFSCVNVLHILRMAAQKS